MGRRMRERRQQREQGGQPTARTTAQDQQRASGSGQGGARTTEQDQQRAYDYTKGDDLVDRFEASLEAYLSQFSPEERHALMNPTGDMDFDIEEGTAITLSQDPAIRAEQRRAQDAAMAAAARPSDMALPGTGQGLDEWKTLPWDGSEPEYKTLPHDGSPPILRQLLSPQSMAKKPGSQ